MVEWEEESWLKLLLIFSFLMRQMNVRNVLPPCQRIFVYFQPYQVKRETSPLGPHKEHVLIM